jgi:probable HAF family extracellular repeat protein
MIEDRQPSTGHLPRDGRGNGRQGRRSVVALMVVGFAAGTSVAVGGFAAHGAEIDQEQAVNPYSGHRWENGQFTDVNDDQPNDFAYPGSINNKSEITGEYIRGDENLNPVRESGLYIDASGRVGTFDVPTARGTEGHDINDAGHIGGAYSTDTPIVNNSTEPLGFLRLSAAPDGTITIRAKNAASTIVNGINDRGEVVGLYQDRGANGRLHGFYWKDGVFTPYDISGAANTLLWDINDLGQIVGSTTTADGKQETGFVIDGIGDDDPTEIRVRENVITSPARINDRSQIVGFTTNNPTDDPELATGDGFLLPEGAGGPVTDIRFFKSPLTTADGLNDRTQIVGLYVIPGLASTAKDNAPKGVIDSRWHR